MSFAGPLVGIVLGGTVLLLQIYVLPPVSGFVAWMLSTWVFVNLGWAVFNLLPVVPLDGGQIVQALTVKRWGGRGFEGTLWLSFVLAVALAATGIFFGQIFLVALFGYLAWTNWKHLQSMGVKNPFRRAPKKPAKRKHSFKVIQGGIDSDDEERPRWLN